MKKYILFVIAVLLFAFSSAYAAEETAVDYTDTYTFAHTFLMPLGCAESELEASLENFKKDGFDVEFLGDSVYGNLYIVEKYYNKEQINIAAVYWFDPAEDNRLGDVEVSFESANGNNFDISLFMEEAFSIYNFNKFKRIDWNITDDPDTWFLVDSFRERLKDNLLYYARIINGQKTQVDNENSSILLGDDAITETYSYTTDNNAIYFIYTIY